LGYDTGSGSAKVPVVAGILVLLMNKSSNTERYFAGAIYNEQDRAGHYL